MLIWIIWIIREKMPTIRIPIWIRSEYVTMGSPPFVRSGDKKLPPVEEG